MFFEFRLSRVVEQYFQIMLRSIMILSILWFSALQGQASENSIPGYDRPLKSASEMDYPPFAIAGPDGSADGFSVELLTKVVRAIGMQIGFTTGTWHVIKQQLAQGELDVLPLVSYSKDRDRVYDFSASYLRLHGTIFVRETEESIQSEADLKDREVIVMRGDNAHEYAMENNLTGRLVLTDTYEEAMKLLSAGRHDAVLMLHLVGVQLLETLNIKNVVSIRDFRETSIRPSPGPLSGYEQKFCFAVKEGNKELLSQLNEGLAIVIASGLYNELYDKWFSPILPEPRVSWARMAKYLSAILFPLLFVMAVLGIWYLKKEVARKTRHLEDEIQVRKETQAILQEREEHLNRTLSDLQASNAELQQFAYVASHDLQEPLRAVVGFLQLLQSRYLDQLDEKGLHYIERAVNAGYRMQGLINDLLMLSRVNTQALSPKQTDLNRIMEAILEDLKPDIQEKNATVTYPDMPVIRVDNNQVSSLFMNLVGNALKYNESSVPAIEITYRLEGDDHCFAVKDNGIGISPKFHDRIFMIFQRLHARQEYSGTGIGLALCKKIVERHNGRIWVESEKSQGSVFYFVLQEKKEEDNGG